MNTEAITKIFRKNENFPTNFRNVNTNLFSILHEKMTSKTVETAETSIEIVNVVVSATLQQAVDLGTIAEAFPNAKYPSPKFPGLVFRLKKPKTATLIFGSGKMICTGGRSEKEATKAVSRVVKELRRKSLVVASKPEVKVENIVASANLGRAVDLERSFLALRGVMYEPEQFPGLVYRMEDPKVVFLIFSSGRVVCVGARTEEEVHRAVDKLHQKIDALNPPSPSQYTLQRGDQIETPEHILVRHINLADFASSGPRGKMCTHIRGLWCHNESCDGPPCRFARWIQGMLEDGFYGCWGFHWQEEWYTTDTKKAQRRFTDYVSD